MPTPAELLMSLLGRAPTPEAEARKQTYLKQWESDEAAADIGEGRETPESVGYRSLDGIVEEDTREKIEARDEIVNKFNKALLRLTSEGNSITAAIKAINSNEDLNLLTTDALKHGLVTATDFAGNPQVQAFVQQIEEALSTSAAVSPTSLRSSM